MKRHNDVEQKRLWAKRNEPPPTNHIKGWSSFKESNLVFGWDWESSIMSFF